MRKRGTRKDERGTADAAVAFCSSSFIIPRSSFLALACLLAGCGLLDGPAKLFSKKHNDVAVAEMGGPPVDAALLQGADWVLTPPDPRTATDPTLPRRRHPTLEPMFALPPADRPNLLPALDLPEAPVRTNAAIGLARWGDGRGLDVLVATVNDSALKQSLREAAAEALGSITKPSPVPALGKLLDRWGRYQPSNVLDYSPELHAVLLRSLSRHVDAADDSRFLEGLRSPTVEARKEALAAFARSKMTEVPVAVADLRGDPDREVRAAAVTLLLDRRHPHALDYAGNALKDYETVVRAAAVEGLGRYGGPEARAALDRIMLHEGEVLRADAVMAYDRMGAWDAVQAAARDQTWRVRRAVAVCTANHPDRAGAALARQFLGDDSAEVRKAVLASLEAWPLPAAGPVLLTAMSEPTFETRRIAGEQLARRWPAAQAFSNDLPPDRRGEVVAELDQKWTAEFGAIDRAALAAAMATDDPNVAPASYTEAISGAAIPAGLRRPLKAERLDQLEQLLRTAAPTDGQAVSLDVFGPDLVDALERLATERGAVLPEFVFLQVLPAKDPSFAALEQLTSDDVQERRRAADRLATNAGAAPLRPLVVVRCVELGVKESDGIVWRDLLAALGGSPSDRSAALAYAGLSHPSPEVRRLSCESLGRSPHPQHTTALLAALSDPHVSVVIEAVRALGHGGMLAEAGPVEPLLQAGDVNLRFAAAETLHRNRLPQGAASIERLGHDRDAEIRRRAAALMATSGDAVFIPTLVELLSDQALGVRQAAVDGLVKIVGTDVSIRPGEPLPSLDDRAAAWRTWARKLGG